MYKKYYIKIIRTKKCKIRIHKKLHDVIQRMENCNTFGRKKI